MGKMGNVQCYTAIRKGKIKSMRCNIELAETVVLLVQKEKRAGSDGYWGLLALKLQLKMKLERETFSLSL